ncbi:uncharacterized protein N7515_000931 [Penicillium bovifimosum]|uniref:Uncharacterized protein n=1 Tax=Penicillium bovifimosum TaxID=126998 RepID=A0A9W9LBJ0_9EURO|nr:uncharacterized protein N7515_000931 [Penicillium bovifimosum]KAJ5146367.1 hypothetical protein N7515_000931 [Penicillium bovifimosum]
MCDAVVSPLRETSVLPLQEAKKEQNPCSGCTLGRSRSYLDRPGLLLEGSGFLGPVGKTSKDSPCHLRFDYG